MHGSMDSPVNSKPEKKRGLSVVEVTWTAETVLIAVRFASTNLPLAWVPST